ncbi:MAG: class I SAM-dependent methyltransferase, partial [Phycisphaerales bacterium]|nr:class I SAM-dependent methyltransferase [Phycisphaerales bacterium]
ASARAILRIARAVLPPPRQKLARILEPASGTGRFILAMAKLGHACTGVDLDPGMVQFARACAVDRGLARRMRFHIGDMRDMPEAIGVDPSKPGQFDLAFCPDNSVRHLKSDRDLAMHLRSTVALLKPGGVYLVGIGLLNDQGEESIEQIWHANRGRTTVRQLIEFIPPDSAAIARGGPAARRELAMSVISVSSPGREEDIRSKYPLRTYTLKQWQAALRQAGVQEIAVLTTDARRVVKHPESRRQYAFRAICAPRQ